MRIAKALFLTLMIGASLPASLAQAETLKVAGPWEITGVEPAQTGYVFTRLQVAETLVTTDKEGALVPGLAENWTVSQDGLVWTFTLRGNAQFHDGTPATAEAAVASLQRALAGVGVLSQAPISEINVEGSFTLADKVITTEFTSGTWATCSGTLPTYILNRFEFRRDRDALFLTGNDLTPFAQCSGEGELHFVAE